VSAAPPQWPRRPSPVLDWLIEAGRHVPTAQDLVGALAERLVDAGVALFRVTFHLQTLHPQLRAVAIIWRRGRPGVETVRVGHGIERSARYLNSPVRVLFEGAGGVRQRLDLPGVDFAFPIFDELRAAGATDYVGLPMTFGDGRVHGTTWTTDQPGGFTSEDLIRIDDLLPLVATILETRLTRRIARNLLDTYVGRHAGERILAGQIIRGTGESVRAAIWYCDLRGFTAMTESLPLERLIASLNDYFECMALPLERHDGEILKFMGDGMLAIFPLDREDAHERALRAAIEAQHGMAQLNERRRASDEPTLGFGIALHAGLVMYGNIGAPTRLDFTVIGPAVNQAVRIEALCRELGRQLLVSATFSRQCPHELVSLGRHALRGVPEPAEIFTLPEAA
jgi:adenylate cyclase